MWGVFYTASTDGPLDSEDEVHAASPEHIDRMIHAAMDRCYALAL